MIGGYEERQRRSRQLRPSEGMRARKLEGGCVGEAEQGRLKKSWQMEGRNGANGAGGGKRGL